MATKPFKIAADWIDYAHGPGAEDGQPVATRLVDLPYNKAARRPMVFITDPLLVAEIVDVAELYCGDPDATGARAGRIFERGVEWLRGAGWVNWRERHKAGMREAEFPKEPARPAATS